MRKLYLLSTLALVVLCSEFVTAQDFSNKGKDFWTGYGYHEQMAGNSQNMVLYFATDQITNITISIPGTGYTQTLTSPAGNSVLTSATIPKTGLQDARLQTEGLSNRGIHITSDKPMVAYAHIYNSSVSGATILFPTNTLGKEYYSVNYKNVSNTANANCFFYVVAADTGTTTVKITPSANTIGGWTAGTTYTVSLTQGQVYNVMGILTSFTNPYTGVDLSGSKIQSVASASGACKKIAVFSGSGRISISCTAASSSSDNYMVQDFPQTAWGKKFLTAPAAGNQSFNIYRVCVSDPTTIVKINGVVTALPLQSNFFYEISQTNQPQMIVADKPITVAQYFSSQGSCGNGNPGDPEVIYLSPVEQNISKVLWNATPNFLITNHYFNVVIPNTGTAISSFRLKDAGGTTLAIGPFTPHPQDANYSYLRQGLPSSGVYSIESDSGFNAIAYGFGSAESYGYNAGTNIKDIFQYVSVENEYATVNFPATCKNTPFYFQMTFPYQPTTIEWQFNGLFPDFSMPDPTLYFIGTITVAGKTLYQYKIPTPYTIATAGTYPIRVVATNPTPDGCGGVQEIDYDVQVFESPIADFNFNNVCFPNPVQFTDNSNTAGRPVTSRYWDFGDATTGTINNPSHPYATPGSYTARYSLITDIGCIADTVEHVVTISPLPTASITGAIEVCLNAPSPAVTFTGAVGTAPYTFTYNINGGPNQIATTSVGNSVTVPAPTNVAGTFTYNLISVADASPAVCSQPQVGSVIVKVNPLPTANITGTISVCKNAPSPNVTFTAAGGAVAPYTFMYNINGGPTLSVTTVAGNSVTVAVPTTVPGTFTYNLVSVQDASTTLCSQAQSGAAIVIVNDLPTASITGTTEVCKNAPSPLVTFTGAGTNAPYTFTYNINGGPNQVVTTLVGNSVTVPAPTNVTGTFNYNLVSVVDGTATLCSQAQIGTATVIVNSLPTALFNVTAPTCESRVLTFTDLSTPNSGALNGWAWTFGDATTSNQQNPTHTYPAAGTYTVTLTVTTDKGCASLPIASVPVTVNTRPQAGFIVPEVCINDAATVFTDTSHIATGSFSPAGYYWDFGDPGSGPANTSTTMNGSHLYTAIGLYHVMHVATSTLGCTDTVYNDIFINAADPVADYTLTNLAALCSSDSVSLINKSTIGQGSITKLQIYWDVLGAPAAFDLDDNPVFNGVYKHKYPTLTTTQNYTVRLIAYSGNVCFTNKTTVITVNATPKVQFLNMPDACLDAAPFQITQATEIGAVAGTGVFSGPGVNATGIFNPALVGPGTYTIKYVYTSSAAGCVDSLSKDITVLDSASANFTYSATACEKSSINFSSGSSTIPAASGTITGWSWNFGDPSSGAANTSTQANPTHTFNNWGTYNVTLFVTTSNGCKSTVRTNAVVINPLPKPNFSLPATACLPSATVSFNNTSTIPDGTQGTFTYLWNFDDPPSGVLNTSTGSSPSHIYNAVGPYNVNLQVTSGAGCMHDTTIVLNTIHPQPTGSFTADKNDICVGESFTFTDNSNPADGTTTQWNWNLGDGNTRTNSSFTYTYGAAGSYDVSLFITNSRGCRSSTFTKTVTVNPYPIVNAGPDLFILQDGSDTIQPIITAINPTYLWTPDSYFLTTNTVMNPIVKGVEDITYTLTVTGRGGCVASDQVFIKVLKGPEIPNIFSPNGDGIHDRWEIKYLDTYPGGTVEIFNRYGQMIFHSVGYGIPWDGTINGKPVPVGTYYYIVNPKNGRKIMSGYVDVIR